MRRRALVAGIAAILAVDVHAQTIQNVPAVGASVADTLTVTNCDDDGPGSLRTVLASAASGDSIDLTQLACSVITLTSGQLATALDTISLHGSGQTISGAGNSRVIAHYGAGTLYASGILFAEGAVTGQNPAFGGCVYSSGSVVLRNVTVRDCLVASAQDFACAARGGGVFSRNDTYLGQSTVETNEVLPAACSYSYASGGGVHSQGTLSIATSTITGNIVEGGGGYVSGGGLSSRSDVSIRESTISGNSAYLAGAAALYGNGASYIVNSTISGNYAVFGNAGIWSHDRLLEIWNSTIAFNSAALPTTPYVHGGGVLIGGLHEYVSLRSSIIADNVVGGVHDDLSLNGPDQTIIGSNNLIMSSNGVVPPDTIDGDPMLAPLADNGGPTPTHALIPGSPAIDAGNNLAGLPYDQRRTGFQRVIGPAADIGAYEVQQPQSSDVIFIDGFDGAH
ncbi:MAG: choice-of-anchor Q domain-containing protein [Rhodanobacteraceae bacterium]